MNAHVEPKTIPLARIFDVSSRRDELERLQDVKLSARSLYEAAVRLQAIPLTPECADYRASCQRLYDEALAEVVEAGRG